MKILRTRRTRAVLPFLVLLVVVGGTLLVHALVQPDQDDPAYLSPVSTEGIGSATLARMLQDRGIPVDRRTTTADALAAARDGDGPATIFVPTPEFAHLSTLTSATGIPPGTRLVLAGADEDVLEPTGWPADVRRTRWAAAATDPACADPVAAAAGRAAVLRHQYATESGTLCYDGGVLGFERDGYDVTLAGAADPFRNDRIGEHSNAALAVGLLARNPRVVWLDLHKRDVPSPEPAPSVEDPGRPDPGAAETASPYPGFPGDNEPGGPGGPGSGDGEPGDGRPAPGEGEGEGDGGVGQSLQDSPLGQAFPPALWATALLVVLVAIAFAAAAARRLGAPVAEPLPSLVPAHETMLGHGRLYQRAQARTRSLEILREAARRRIADHLGLPAHASTDEIAAAARLPAEYVHEILAGDPPGTDDDLVTAARFLQDLERSIIHRAVIHRVEGDTP
jgi:hypothetical protein